MQLAYEKLMEEHKLSIGDLPEEARTAIKSIKGIQKGLELSKDKGQSPKKETIDKLKLFDKVVVEAIIEITDKDDDDQGTSSDATDDEKNALQAHGDAIVEELKALKESGQEEFTGDEIQAKAPKAYKALYDVYEKDETNGVKAGNLLLKETTPGSLIFKFI